MQSEEISALEKLKALLPKEFWEVITCDDFAQFWQVFSDYVKEKWELSYYGFVNQGSDPRTFGRIAAFLQHLISYHPSKPMVEPPYETLFDDGIIFCGSPGYACCNLKINDTRYWHMRAGLRADINWQKDGQPWGGYIISFAAKFTDHPVIWK